jgi:hypothetical protein
LTCSPLVADATADVPVFLRVRHYIMWSYVVPGG